MSLCVTYSTLFPLSGCTFPSACRFSHKPSVSVLLVSLFVRPWQSHSRACLEVRYVVKSLEPRTFNSYDLSVPFLTIVAFELNEIHCRRVGCTVRIHDSCGLSVWLHRCRSRRRVDCILNCASDSHDRSIIIRPNGVSSSQWGILLGHLGGSNAAYCHVLRQARVETLLCLRSSPRKVRNSTVAAISISGPGEFRVASWLRKIY